MQTVWLLVPDFVLIILGFWLCKHTSVNRTVWDSVEKLVYHLLFPVLLFGSIVKSPMHPAQTWTLAAGGLFVLLSGMLLAYQLRWWPGINGHLHASGAQTSFRFNSYVALALADRLVGAQGVAWMALLIALCVPLANMGAVWFLARHGGQNTWKEILRNPLIVATLSGLGANLLEVPMPETVSITLQRIGGAALPLGLMAVGAGLRIEGLTAAPGLAALLMTIRHAILPLLAIVWSEAMAVPAPQRLTLVAFAALPTASSAFVLAVRMGGHGPFVAGLITLSTLLGMVSIPVWIAVALQRWAG